MPAGPCVVAYRADSPPRLGILSKSLVVLIGRLSPKDRNQIELSDPDHQFRALEQN